MGLTLLNLGSGPFVAEGWISIDSSWGAWLARRPLLARLAFALGLVSTHHRAVEWPAKGILCHDVRRGLPFPTGSVHGVFAAHFFEHLTREEGAALLAECHRVLEPGGAIRLVVPDLEPLARWYVGLLDGGSHERAVGSHRFLSMLNPAGVKRWPESAGPNLARFVSRAGHRAFYDRHSMTRALEEAGFSQIGLRAPLESRLPGIERVERPAHHETSICLEAVR